MTETTVPKSPGLRATAAILLLALSAPGVLQAESADPRWSAAFELDLQPGESVLSLLDSPCRSSALQDQFSCQTIWGTVTGADGTEQLAGWYVETEGSEHAPGGRVHLSGSLDLIPTSVLAQSDDVILFAENALFQVRDAAQAANVTPLMLDSRDEDDGYLGTPERLAQFGIFDVSYSAPMDLFVIGLFGELTFWQATPDGAALTGLCRVTADGAVPWLDIQIGPEGDLIAAAHGAWTMIVQLPDRETLGPAQGTLPVCAETLASDIHYLSLRALSPSGELTAVEDRNFLPAPEGIMPEVADYALGIYRTDWLLTAPNQGTPLRSATQVVADGLVATLSGHDSPIAQAEIAADDSTVLTVTENGTLVIWSLPDGALLTRLATIDGNPVARATFAGGARCLLVSLREGGTLLLDTNGTVLQRIAPPSARFSLGPGQAVVTYSPGAAPPRVYAANSAGCAG